MNTYNLNVRLRDREIYTTFKSERTINRSEFKKSLSKVVQDILKDEWNETLSLINTKSRIKDDKILKLKGIELTDIDQYIFSEED